MLSKFNSYLRILFTLFLITPTTALAEDVPNEVTVNESFEDSTYETGLTISGGSQDAYIYCQEQGRYGTTGCSLAIQSGTYLFEFAEDVYEIGFLVGAVNNTYDVKYYFSDETDETIQKAGQSWGEDGNAMYDDFYKSFTDYNNDEANTDKFITKFEVTITDISVLDTLYWQYVEIPVTSTTSSTTTSSTTTTTTTTTIPPTTTTTTLPPKVEEVYVEPEPLPPPPEEIIVDIVVDGVDKTYTQADVNDGTIERDQERVDNEAEFGCFMTDAQIERGDCIIIIKEEKVEEVVDEKIIIENKEDVEVIIPKDDVTVLDTLKEEIPEDEVVEFEKLPIEFEIIEFDLEEIVTEVLDEIPIQDEKLEEILNEEVKEDVKEVLDEPIQEVVSEDTPTTTLPRVENEEKIEQEVAELVESIEEIILIDIPDVTEEAIEEYVEELETVEVVEILEEVNDVGLENLAEVSEEVIEVVAQVVEEVITIAQEEELTEEQVEVVAEVLGFTETEDVEIIAEAVKNDKNIAQAVDEFVERAVENADKSSQPYTLADATTEIAFESFIASPISVIIDVDLDDISLNNIANDMTQDQKDKAHEVIIPTILVRVVSLAMRRFD